MIVLIRFGMLYLFFKIKEALYANKDVTWWQRKKALRYCSSTEPLGLFPDDFPSRPRKTGSIIVPWCKIKKKNLKVAQDGSYIG